MYAKIKDNQVIKYPFTSSDLYSENPFTNFGSINLDLSTPEEIINVYSTTETGQQGYQLVVVNILPKPSVNNLIEKVEPAIPKLVNGIWVDEWFVRPLSQVELNNIEAFKSEETQQTQEEISFAQAEKLKSSNKEVWDQYIQALNDVLVDPKFPYANYPTRPSV